MDDLEFLQSLDLKQLAEMQEKHRQELKANREKIQARKARTHRLIVRGAIAEKFVPGADRLTNEQFEAALKALFFQR